MSQEQGASPPHRADSERSLEQREKRRAKIIAARMKLRARFQSAMRSSPAQSDLQPLGAGPPNRHGMPQTPPGQHLVHKWPVLDLGVHPLISQDDWSLKIEGLVTQPQQLRWADMLSLEQVEDRSDFHCVTTWSKLDMGWTGVRVSTLLALAEPLEEARFALCHGADGYTTNLPLSELLKDDVLLVHRWEGEPLPREHGGPARLITPQLYAWKGTKWITRIELLAEDQLGFWEQRGYSNSAHPWRDDRYS